MGTISGNILLNNQSSQKNSHLVFNVLCDSSTALKLRCSWLFPKHFQVRAQIQIQMKFKKIFKGVPPNVSIPNADPIWSSCLDVITVWPQWPTPRPLTLTLTDMDRTTSVPGEHISCRSNFSQCRCSEFRRVFHRQTPFLKSNIFTASIQHKVRSRADVTFKTWS